MSNYIKTLILELNERKTKMKKIKFLKRLILTSGFIVFITFHQIYAMENFSKINQNQEQKKFDKETEKNFYDK